ncbi:hypothetical protein [Haliangium sp.]|uniref:hypothetical protein n=1 Tax=Haliangium sp. TaxID=2663208 RepID=UPI003D0D67F8
MTAPAPHPPGVDLDTVRKEIRALLGRSQAFQALTPGERQLFARNLVKVGSFLSDSDWLDDSRPVRAEALAEGPVAGLREGLAEQAKGTRANDFQAAAVTQGVEAFGNLVKTVDFPAFVSGLIQGVFQAVVDASIQQMRAFAELMAAASMTVDQFARDQIGGDEARRQLVGKYPDALELREDDGGASQLQLRDDYDGDLDVGADYGLDSVDLSDPESEATLVMAARREMAAARQQMLATMVVLGINRIVVTNGRINAKVVFDVEASDEAQRKAKAAMSQAHAVQTKAGFGGGIAPMILGTGGASVSTQHTTKVSSSVDDTSESKAKLKAQLTGEVRLNFKSETFPLEKMADSISIGNLQQAADPNAMQQRARESSR